jgi:hypothetical protein
MAVSASGDVRVNQSVLLRSAAFTSPSTLHFIRKTETRLYVRYGSTRDMYSLNGTYAYVNLDMYDTYLRGLYARRS